MDMTMWNGIPAYPSDKVENYESTEGTMVFKINNATVPGYLAYRKALEDAGFVLYTENTIEKNLFATYTKGEYIVNVYYMDRTKVTRIVRETGGSLPVLPKDNHYEEKVESLLISVDLEHIMFWEGMSYIIRLCDNSFIMIDGGVSDPDGIEIDKHMALLRKYTPEGEKPVIAAWMFTHCHGDHLGLFPEFAVKYHDEVVVESFIFNFPPVSQIEKTEPFMLDDSNFRYYAFQRSLAAYYPNTPIIRPHTGNIICVRNATFEVLGTHEDLYPAGVHTPGLNCGINATSVLCRMEIGGQTTMWLGDAAEITGDLALEQFGDYLKSDMMQLAHHGGPGGTIRLYERINPEIGLQPVEGEIFNTSYPPTDWLCNKSENVKMVVVSGFGTVAIPLPFTPNTEKYRKLPPYTDEFGGRNPEILI